VASKVLFELLDGIFNDVCKKNKKNVDKITRRQAVARIADRTASQHLRGSHDVIGQLTIWLSLCHFLLVVLWNRVSKSSRFRDITR